MGLGKVGIIFNGGGFAGAFSVGFAKAIYKNGIKPDVIQGVSVGALTATKTVESGIEEAEKVWLDIEKRGPKTIFDWGDILWTVGSMVKYSPVLSRVIKPAPPQEALFKNTGVVRMISETNMRMVVDSEVELQILTRNESQNKKTFIFRNHEERFKENPELFGKAVLASTAIPGGFPRVLIDGEYHSDGALYYMRPLVQAGCDTIFLLLNDQSSEGQNRWDQRLGMGKHILYDELVALRIEKLLREYKDYDVISDDSEESPSFMREIKKIAKGFGSVMASAAKGDDINFVPHRIFVLAPRKPISTLHTFGFERGDIKAAIEQGEDQAKLLIKKVLKMSY